MRKADNSPQCTFAFASTSSIACLTVSNFSRFCELLAFWNYLSKRGDKISSCSNFSELYEHLFVDAG